MQLELIIKMIFVIGFSIPQILNSQSIFNTDVQIGEKLKEVKKKLNLIEAPNSDDYQYTVVDRNYFTFRYEYRSVSFERLMKFTIKKRKLSKIVITYAQFGYSNFKEIEFRKVAFAEIGFHRLRHYGIDPELAINGCSVSAWGSNAHFDSSKIEFLRIELE